MHKLVLPLLGERDYLHGTTMFDTLCGLYSPGERLVFKIPHMAFSNTVEVNETPENATAALSWRNADGSAREVFVHPLPMTEPVTHAVFDEERTVATGEWSSGRICAHPPHDESFVRCVVPLHKALLKREIPHTDPGQWLFTRLELPRPLVPGRELTLTLRQTFGGAAALSDIANEHGPVGSIFFSWLKK